MEELELQLTNLQNKLQLLLKQSQHLIKENISLKNENEQLVKALNKKDETIQKMQQQIDALKFNNVMDEDEKKHLEKRIDEYLREIDKCLSILNT
jgi:chromosome segregation ATPase